MKKLSAAERGIVRIKWMFGVPEIMNFLRDRDIKEGQEIAVVQQNGSNMIIGNDRCRIAIGADTAERIQVQQISCFA